MINLPKFLACLSVTALGLVLLAGPVQAETTAAETAYVFNTLLFLMCGFLVMFMAAGLPCSKAAWSEPKMSAQYVSRISRYTQ